MRTIAEFCEFYGIKKLTHGRNAKKGTKRFTARFQDHNGDIQTLFYAEKIDFKQELYVMPHSGLTEKGEVTEQSARLKGSLWVVNSGWAAEGTTFEKGE
jgi:hypothetical protein